MMNDEWLTSGRLRRGIVLRVRHSPSIIHHFRHFRHFHHFHHFHHFRCILALCVWCVWTAGHAGASEPSSQAAAPPFYADKSQLLIYLDERGDRHIIKNAGDWEKRRRHIIANMELVMGPLPDAGRGVPLDVKVLEEVVTPKYTLRKITYQAEKDDRVPAYLLVPKARSGKVPAILCLHQTTNHAKAEPAGLAGLPNLHYAKELAERGYVTIAPDYPGFGDCPFNVYERGYASVSMKGVWNHMRAIDLLRSMPEVDAERIGCIGHSLGGYNALFVAAFDTRIKAVVTSCGFTSFAKYAKGRAGLAPWGSDRHHMPRVSTVYGNDPARMPFDFSEVLAAIAPRAVFVNAPPGDGCFDISGVHDCLDAARPAFALLNASENLVAIHPPGGHDFPPHVREAAYAMFDRVLRGDETPAKTRPAAGAGNLPDGSGFQVVADARPAAVVYAPGENQWAGKRLVDRVHTLTGTSLMLEVGPEVPAGRENLIAVGTPESNAVVRDALAVDDRLADLGEEGYILKVTRWRDCRTLVAGGRTVPGVNNAVSELVSWKLRLTDAGAAAPGNLDESDKPALKYRFLWNWDSRTNWETSVERMHAIPANSYSLQDQGEAGFLTHFRRAVDYYSDHKLNGLTIWGFIHPSHGGVGAAEELARYAKRRNVRMMPGICSEAAYGGFTFDKTQKFSLDNWTAKHPELRYKTTQGEFIAGLCPSKPENVQWLREGTEWFFQAVPDAGGMNLENGDWFYCWTDDCIEAKSKPGNDPNFFWDQSASYTPVLETAARVRPDAWMVFATYAGFTKGAIEGAMDGAVKTRRAAGVATEVVYPPRFLPRMPANGICQWTLTGMVTPEAWPEGAKPPPGSFKEHIGYIHQSGAVWPPSKPDRWWAGAPGSAWEDVASIIQFVCRRLHSAGMCGLVIYGERGAASPANELNYVAFEYFSWHPERTWEQFVQDRLAVCYGGRERAELFLKLLRNTTKDTAIIAKERHQATAMAAEPALEVRQRNRWKNLADELTRRITLVKELQGK
jgi:dienelactone hydrolase